MKIKAILMDLGKTIIDNYSCDFSLGFLAIHKFLKNKNILVDEYSKKGLQMVKETYKNREKTGNEVKLIDFLSLLNKEFETTFTISIEEIEDIFLENMMIDHIYDNAIDFLSEMNSLNVPVLILSNSTITARALKKEVERFGVLDKVVDLISSADFGKRKPEASFFSYGFDCLKKKYPYITKEETVYIGNDYYYDVKGSFNAGLTPIWFNHNKEIDNQAISLFDFYSYKDLISKIKKFF